MISFHFSSKVTLALVLWLIFANISQANELTITVYVDQSNVHLFDSYQKEASSELTIVPLFNLIEIEKKISEGLPNNEETAAPIALQRVRAMEGILQAAWRQALLLHRLDVTHLPAIVFNQGTASEAVWYGSRLDQALTAYRGWQP